MQWLLLTEDNVHAVGMCGRLRKSSVAPLLDTVPVDEKVCDCLLHIHRYTSGCFSLFFFHL